MSTHIRTKSATTFEIRNVHPKNAERLASFLTASYVRSLHDEDFTSYFFAQVTTTSGETHEGILSSAAGALYFTSETGIALRSDFSVPSTQGQVILSQDISAVSVWEII